MFCLRSFYFILFLTNAAPIYVLLFLGGSYALHRPCVYCSILLFVLVFSLFDFSADWFEPRWDYASHALSASETLTSFISGNATVTDAVLETASLAISAINGTGGSLASAAMGTMKRRYTGGGGGGNATAAAGGGFEWLRSVLEKQQFRIPCVDVVVRL